jgi:hypothetical protein
MAAYGEIPMAAVSRAEDPNVALYANANGEQRLENAHGVLLRSVSADGEDVEFRIYSTPSCSTSSSPCTDGPQRSGIAVRKSLVNRGFAIGAREPITVFVVGFGPSRPGRATRRSARSSKLRTARCEVVPGTLSLRLNTRPEPWLTRCQSGPDSGAAAAGVYLRPKGSPATRRSPRLTPSATLLQSRRTCAARSR